jgi:hypothetical protein
MLSEGQLQGEKNTTGMESRQQLEEGQGRAGQGMCAQDVCCGNNSVDALLVGTINHIHNK